MKQFIWIGRVSWPLSLIQFLNLLFIGRIVTQLTNIYIAKLKWSSRKFTLNCRRFRLCNSLYLSRARASFCFSWTLNRSTATNIDFNRSQYVTEIHWNRLVRRVAQFRIEFFVSFVAFHHANGICVFSLCTQKPITLSCMYCLFFFSRAICCFVSLSPPKICFVHFAQHIPRYTLGTPRSNSSNAIVVTQQSTKNNKHRFV